MNEMPEPNPPLSQTPQAPTPIPEPVITPFNPPKKSNHLGIIGMIIGIILFCIFGTIAFIQHNQIQTLKNTTNTIVREATPSIQITPTTKATMTPTLTPKPTNFPTSTPRPTSTNTPTPMPTPTPTRTPSPPQITISFPQEGQVVTQSNSQICIVDTPSGGDTSGVNRKSNINNQGWTGYASLYTLCFGATTGANSVMLQYRNSYNEESPVYTRNFTYQP